MTRAFWLYCKICRRIREILLEAPWSILDLLMSAIVSGIGLYLLLRPGMFKQVGGVYAMLAQIGSEWLWGWSFFCCGGFGFIVCLWCTRPSFVWRLMARMMVAFCLLSFALNNLSFYPPPLSVVTYSVLSLAAIWGIMRTKSSGR